MSENPNPVAEAAPEAAAAVQQSNVDTAAQAPVVAPPAEEKPEPTKAEIQAAQIAQARELADDLIEFLNEVAKPNSDLTLAISNINDGLRFAKSAIERS